MNRQSYHHQNHGFVLLYAVLVSGIVLGVGLSLVNLFAKQIILSSIGRNSQFAYYAADAGKRCALFWEAEIIPVFGVINDVEVTVPGPDDLPPELLVNNEPIIYCHNQAIDLRHNQTTDVLGRSGIETTFTLAVGGNGSPSSCAEIRVRKVIDDSDPNSRRVETEIRSSGYNASCDDLASGIKNPRRIERVVYQIVR